MFCEPDIGPLETTDDRVYTTTVTPRTDQVAHNYTLTLTVPAGRVTSAAENKQNCLVSRSQVACCVVARWYAVRMSGRSRRDLRGREAAQYAQG